MWTSSRRTGRAATCRNSARRAPATTRPWATTSFPSGSNWRPWPSCTRRARSGAGASRTRRRTASPSSASSRESWACRRPCPSRTTTRSATGGSRRSSWRREAASGSFMARKRGDLASRSAVTIDPEASTRRPAARATRTSGWWPTACSAAARSRASTPSAACPGRTRATATCRACRAATRPRPRSRPRRTTKCWPRSTA
mmetsp:Transcript_7896/g.23508  ORF Transcript_7896/g.23508 Transcript_7896/m.23508 type:complete len:200 (-) Transcript_7896:737-1336(-)